MLNFHIGLLSGRRIYRAWKAGLGSQSSAEPLGFCKTFLQQALYYVKRSAEPSCRTPKALQNSENLWEPGPVFWGPAFFPPTAWWEFRPPQKKITGKAHSAWNGRTSGDDCWISGCSTLLPLPAPQKLACGFFIYRKIRAGNLVGLLRDSVEATTARPEYLSKFSEHLSRTNLHSSVWADRNDKGQTHPNLHPQTGVMTSQPSRKQICTLPSGDNRPVDLLKPGCAHSRESGACWRNQFNSAQNGCIVSGKAQKINSSGKEPQHLRHAPKTATASHRLKTMHSVAHTVSWSVWSSAEWSASQHRTR